MHPPLAIIMILWFDTIFLCAVFLCFSDFQFGSNSVLLIIYIHLSLQEFPRNFSMGNPMTPLVRQSYDNFYFVQFASSCLRCCVIRFRVELKNAQWKCLKIFCGTYVTPFSHKLCTHTHTPTVGRERKEKSSIPIENHGIFNIIEVELNDISSLHFVCTFSEIIVFPNLERLYVFTVYRNFVWTLNYFLFASLFTFYKITYADCFTYSIFALNFLCFFYCALFRPSKIWRIDVRMLASKL